MQRLHLVGFTSELDGLIFSAASGARSGGYVVTVDAELLDAIREVLLRRESRSGGPRQAPVALTMGPTGRLASGLTPKEIQARLRAGRSVAEVAFEAGVGEDWVRRLAPPVFAEQAHMVARALTVPVTADDGEPGPMALGDAVSATLADRGVVLTADELVAGWSALQVGPSSWVVQFRDIDGGPEIVARWAFDVRQGTLVPLDPSAAELARVAGRSARPPVEPPAAVAPTPTPTPGPPEPADPPQPPRPTVRRAPAVRAVPRRARPKAGRGGAGAAHPTRGAGAAPAGRAGAPRRAAAGREAGAVRPGGAHPPFRLAAGVRRLPAAHRPRPRRSGARRVNPGAASPAGDSGDRTGPGGDDRELTDRVLGVLRDAGLVAGVAPADPFDGTRHDLEVRKRAGLHGGMAFTYRNPARSTDPGRSLDGARSLVVGALGYLRDGPPADPDTVALGRVARYAWSDAYRELTDRLGRGASVLRAGGYRSAVVADQNALVDREAAHRAGLGWYGRNANLLLPGRGSWYVLGTVVTDAPLVASPAPEVAAAPAPGV